MDMKMQKRDINFARHRTNGFILDFIVKALDVEQKDKAYQKIYQRFVKEENISVDEYNDTLNTILEDLLHNFFEKHNENNYKFIDNYIKELLSYYSKYKLYNETLATSQKQLDLITIKNLFIPFVRLSIKDKKTLMIVERILPDSTKNPLQKLFSIIEESFIDKELMEEKLYALINKKPIGYDSVNKSITHWLYGKSIPHIANVKILVDLYKYSKEFSKEELNFYFKIAKILDYLYKKSIKYFGEEKTILFIKDFRNKNIDTNDKSCVEFLQLKALKSDKYIKDENKIIKSYIEKNRKKVDLLYKVNEVGMPDMDFYNYSNKLAKLFELTHPQNKKTNDSETLYKKLQIEFKNRYTIDNNPYFQFVEARYFAQKREYKKSVECYLSALRNGKNVMGEFFKVVCEEGLIVSSLVTRETKIDLTNAKSSFTKFYKEAYFYGFIEELPKEKSEYFLNDMKKQFDIYFKNLLIGVTEGNTNIITPNFAVSSKKIKLDFKNPNKLIKKDLPNPITQLMYCTRDGDYESTLKLIEFGADVNILKQSDNASALILTFPPSNIIEFDRDRIKIMKLLIPKMSPTALNTQLIKERETALSYAIEAGLVDVVKLLINYGVDINQKATLDKLTPLYLSIQCIHKADKGIPNSDTIKNSKFDITNPLQSKEELKKLAKANNFSSSIFDDDRIEDTLHLHNITNKRHIESEGLINSYYQNNYNMYNEIFDILLKYTKNVDISNGKFKITPLIFATKINNEEIVKKLLEKGANPDWNILINSGELVRAYDYAQRNKNKTLMDLLY